MGWEGEGWLSVGLGGISDESSEVAKRYDLRVSPILFGTGL